VRLPLSLRVSAVHANATVLSFVVTLREEKQVEKIFLVLSLLALIWLPACKSAGSANPNVRVNSVPSPENTPSAEKPPVEATIRGIHVKIASAERVKNIAEGKSNIRAGEGQEFLKVALTLAANSSKAPAEEFNKLAVGFVEANNNESGIAFNWRFFDKSKSVVRVYTYPKPINTQYKGIKIENVLLALPAN